MASDLPGKQSQAPSSYLLEPCLGARLGMSYSSTSNSCNPYSPLGPQARITEDSLSSCGSLRASCFDDRGVICSLICTSREQWRAVRPPGPQLLSAYF